MTAGSSHRSGSSPAEPAVKTDAARNSPDETATWYRRFGLAEARGQSALFEEWSAAIAEDPEVLALIETLPLQKRQPNLIFACARLLGAPESAYVLFRAFFLAHWPAIAAEARQRSTQTNEARRCASLLPALALIDGPIALLEVGASAGLCLYPDRYSYSYDGRAAIDPVAGASTVLLESTTTGSVPLPSRLPTIVWRAGLDLNPLDVNSADDSSWLETLIWPEQHERRQRLRSAMEIVRSDPPLLVKGHAIDALVSLAATAPPDSTLVIITSAVLVYLPRAERLRFVHTVTQLDARWISLEGMRGLPAVQAALPDGTDFAPDAAARYVLALDQKPLAFTGPHGQSLDWLS